MQGTELTGILDKNMQNKFVLNPLISFKGRKNREDTNYIEGKWNAL